MRRTRALAGLAAVAIAGCASGALPENGRAICAQPPERCPDGYYCATDNTCWRLGQAPDLSPDFSACPDEGTPCGVAPDACHGVPLCKSGVCTPTLQPDNTVCADPGPKMPCKSAGVCTNGVCGAITDVKDGTPCTMPTNPCTAPGTCTGGVCGPESMRDDGYQYDMSDYKFRCCSGKPSSLDSASSCGACGIKCAGGFNCVYNGGKVYWCACGGDDTNCLFGTHCCALSGNVCTASTCVGNIDCIQCPGNAVCGKDAPHFYCHY